MKIDPQLAAYAVIHQLSGLKYVYNMYLQIAVESVLAQRGVKHDDPEFKQTADEVTAIVRRALAESGFKKKE